jgi:predicted component of type VI protein secretion system
MDNPQTTSSSEDRSSQAQQSSTEAWHEVGRQFKTLGESLAAAFRVAWEDEDNRRHMKAMQDGLETMASEINQAIKQAAATQEAQHVREHAQQAAVSARAAGEKAFQEGRPHLLAALRQVDAELRKMIANVEGEQPPGGPPAGGSS